MRPVERPRPAVHPAAVAAAGIALALLFARPARAVGDTLECVGIRRLADNYLLDLRVRFVFDTAHGRYTRFEDGGRGWQEVSAGGRWRRGPGGRVILEENPSVTAYLERLTGAYYYIDRSGVTLSVWGHCGVSGPPNPLF